MTAFRTASTVLCHGDGEEGSSEFRSDTFASPSVPELNYFEEDNPDKEGALTDTSILSNPFLPTSSFGRQFSFATGFSTDHHNGLLEASAIQPPGGIQLPGNHPKPSLSDFTSPRAAPAGNEEVIRKAFAAAAWARAETAQISSTPVSKRCNSRHMTSSRAAAPPQPLFRKPLRDSKTAVVAAKFKEAVWAKQKA